MGSVVKSVPMMWCVDDGVVECRGSKQHHVLVVVGDARVVIVPLVVRLWPWMKVCDDDHAVGVEDPFVRLRRVVWLCGS